MKNYTPTKWVRLIKIQTWDNVHPTKIDSRISVSKYFYIHRNMLLPSFDRESFFCSGYCLMESLITAKNPENKWLWVLNLGAASISTFQPKVQRPSWRETENMKARVGEEHCEMLSSRNNIDVTHRTAVLNVLSTQDKVEKIQRFCSAMTHYIH